MPRRSGPALAFTMIVLLAAAANAQAPATPGAAPDAAVSTEPEDVEELMKRLQEKIDRLNQATNERDEALKFLQEQVDAATGQLGASDKTTDTLRSKTEALSTTLDTLNKDREALAEQLEQIQDERDRRIQDLEAQLAKLNDALATGKQERATLASSLEASRDEVAAGKDRVEGLRSALTKREQELSQRDQDLAKLSARIEELNKVLAGERQQGESLNASLEASAKELGAARDKVASLESAVNDREAALGSVQTKLVSMETQLDARGQDIARLNRLLVAATEQLRQVGAALDSSESKVKSQEVMIANLGQQLNTALLSKVEELARYRSEFFGRLREILGDRPDLRVVGDRFVFQSELLFDSGSATLGREGQKQLSELADSLKEVAAKIPEDVDWVLRVDGHTDRVPVAADSNFRSNWELSTARAISVVEFLIRAGIPPNRLAAAGFGEYQPLDPRDDEIGYRRNRRIEFKLTER